MTFAEKLAAAVRRNRTLLCLGLDPDPARLPLADPIEFCRRLIDATRDLVCCYKPNAAFFEQYGADAFRLLEKIRRLIPDDIPALLDAKRGDVGHTAAAYARAAFEVLGYDACTVSPYLGGDSLEPWLAYPGRAVFVLCRTSNPGARDFQDLPVRLPDGRLLPLYRVVAERCREWNRGGNVGLVVGATFPEELSAVRAICPDQPILVPGIGVQGGTVERAIAAGRGASPEMLLLAVSRQILYAATGPDWERAARAEAARLRREIAVAAHLER
ncbi:MAG: orotidine-5'-phosphate decarboxylase [Chloroflexota bacterium]|nr:orotidine-5'-phosphate decarboxylase [Dehalococcoidia bacterium]MDW8254260.1 orotidine-5'-phosphate decarboxylase [Chloroflexota bacterium]